MNENERTPIQNSLDQDNIVKIQVFKARSREALDALEDQYRELGTAYEHVAYAVDTSYSEIAEVCMKDRDGDYQHELLFVRTIHRSINGLTDICAKAERFLEEMKKTVDFDILSISSHMEESRIILKVLVRPYSAGFNFIPFFDYIGEKPIETKRVEHEVTTGQLVIPDEIKNFSYTEDEIAQHDASLEAQNLVLESSTYDKPFLNQLTKYTPKKLPRPEERIELIYDLKTNDMKMDTVASYEQFNHVFEEIMNFVNGIEYYNYVSVMMGDKTEESFMDFLKAHVEEAYIKTGRLPVEDLPVMMQKLYRSLFQMYVLQDLIDDPKVTDIKVTAPDSIRARVKGKAYMSNINFIDKRDYLRFVDGIAKKNHISLNVPSQTFTDDSDPNYIMRLSITAEYVNSVKWPYLHIRKINRNKLLGPDLIKLGMFDEKTRDYLLDCGKTSRGVVFAGPPGSGKTVALNWFLEEAYEQSAEILVIQENDELFAYRHGVMFQHVVNYPTGNEQSVNLEQLGQLALVAGANVFVIGEAKGPEICSAITLSNSGCRTALTIHSPSSTETLDKMADLAQRGYAKDYEQAMRMLKSFQTIVYMEDFSVKEISEIIGYDEKTKQMKYRYIYRKPEVAENNKTA